MIHYILLINTLFHIPVKLHPQNLHFTFIILGNMFYLYYYFFPQDIEIEVCGILNDTTGTLMSCCWKNPNCRVGVIVGEFSLTYLYISITDSYLFFKLQNFDF